MPIPAIPMATFEAIYPPLVIAKNIAIADIEELSLKDTIPTINKRVTGIMLTNGKKKGYFNLDGKNARLYLYNDESPFIYIKTSKDQYYINLTTTEETKTFYNEIMKEKS